MPKHTDRERRRLTEWALVQRALGRSFSELAEEAAVGRHTLSRWVNDELAILSEHRSVSEDRERAIVVYEKVIRSAWERLEQLDHNCTNVPGLMNTIIRAQTRIDKLTGAEAPIKYAEPECEIIVEWEDDLKLCPRCYREERRQSPEAE